MQLMLLFEPNFSRIFHHIDGDFSGIITPSYEHIFYLSNLFIYKKVYLRHQVPTF